MARRGKLEKFAKLLTYPHVFEMTEPGNSKLKQRVNQEIELKGQWKQYVFQNNNPLCLELACGRGEYSVGLARLHPEVNYMGVDIKGARIYKGATIALNENLDNVAFLRIRIEQIDLYFDQGEINEIWITFPDPFPAKENRRLTAPMFLDKYHKLLKKGAKIHLKTDDDALFEYSVETALKDSRFSITMKCENIAELRTSMAELNISTYYEKQHLENKKTIKYLLLVKND